jgi:ATP-dependent protease ClpP protease subunit
MNQLAKSPHRFWGEKPLPKSKAEFFDAVTMPAPVGEGTVATIRMYGPIDSWGGFWGISTKDVGQVLDALPDSVSQIILRINSPGGEVFEGVSILNMLRAHKAKVTAVVDGLAASAASVIVAGCDEAVMSPATQMMIHSPWTFTLGNAAELRKDADRLDGIEASLIEIYQAKAGDKDWPALLAEETWYTAPQAVEAGLADRVDVVPDAGDAETVGEEEPVIVVVPLEGEDEDSARITQIAAFSRAHKLPSSSEPGDPNQKEELTVSDTIKAGLRERLGVTDADASDETLLAALDEALNEQAEPTDAPAALPEGAIIVDKAAYEETKRKAEAGQKAMDAIDKKRRDDIIIDALKAGRIASESKDTWRTQLDKDEDGITKILASLPASGAVPVTEIGHSDTLNGSDEALYSSAFPTEEVAR